MSRAWEGYARSKGIAATNDTALTADDVRELQAWMSEHD